MSRSLQRQGATKNNNTKKYLNLELHPFQKQLTSHSAFASDSEFLCFAQQVTAHGNQHFHFFFLLAKSLQSNRIPAQLREAKSGSHQKTKFVTSLSPTDETLNPKRHFHNGGFKQQVNALKSVTAVKQQESPAGETSTGMVGIRFDAQFSSVSLEVPTLQKNQSGLFADMFRQSGGNRTLPIVKSVANGLFFTSWCHEKLSCLNKSYLSQYHLVTSFLLIKHTVQAQVWLRERISYFQLIWFVPGIVNRQCFLVLFRCVGFACRFTWLVVKKFASIRRTKRKI